MTPDAEPFLDKALASLTGAESEFTSGRYDNCANRCYYACFQAAVAALQWASIRPPGTEWSHAFVPSQFDGVLINRRKLYPPDLRGVLGRNFALRSTADYNELKVAEVEARRALARARTFVAAIQRGGARQ